MILAYIGISVAILVIILVLVVAMQPTDFRIARSATMSASAADIFSRINDLHRWADWSPWDKIDPNLKRTHEGAQAGVGAIYSWNGNSKVGEGRMTIIESRPGELIRIKLEFFRPFKATNETDFTLHQTGTQTNVTWAMVGRNNFMAKAFGLIMNMDQMVGADFEKGLASLKAIVEAPAKQ